MAETNRKFLYDALTSALGYDVHNIGQNYKYESSPYLVLRYDGQDESTNRLGAYSTWEVQVYVPDTSMMLIDGILDKVEEVLTNAAQNIETTGQRGGDYHDEAINMYMNYIQFRVPRTIRGCVA